MPPQLLHAWVASIPGIGPKRFALLFELFPDLTKLLSISHATLIRRGIPDRLAAAIVSHQRTHPIETIATFCTQTNTQVLSLFDPTYPKLLSQIPDPPIVLYVQGTLPHQSIPRIAVVGTRKITSYGTQVTKEITTQLVQAGCCIVSGFMYGVDAVAHTAAIDAGGVTIAVLGYGFGVPFYPREHTQLAKHVLQAGSCLVTEYPPWEQPDAKNFPRRNRIVSGMSVGVVVTEAASKSGTKITANLAVDQGRDVFAVPGPITSIFSEGTKDLVNNGAKLVTSATDVLEELHIDL